MCVQHEIGKEPPIDVVIVYGGEEDWVDKQGANHLAKLYPRRVQVVESEGGHSLPFYRTAMAALIDKYLV